MPVKLNIDYNLAFDLFTRGLIFKEIAPKVGCREATLRKFAARHKWTEQVSQARQAVAQVVQTVAKKEHKAIAARAEHWIDRTACDIERTSETLIKLDVPQDLDGIIKHETAWGMHVKRGRSVFGLDQPGASVTLQVGLFSGDTGKIRVSTGPPTDPQGQIVDVQPEVEPESPS